MNYEQLEKAKELEELIRTTGNGIESLKKGRAKVLEEKRFDDKHYEDEIYNLTVCKESDGSGFNAKLTRYFGNLELLDMIIEKLEEQLAFFEAEFEKL